MGRFIRTTIGVLAATVGVTALMATPAAADQPVVLEDFTDSADVVIPAEIAPCDFEIRLQQEVSVKVTLFFDQDGETRQIKVHVNGTALWSKPEGGVVLTDRWVVNEFQELPPGATPDTQPLSVALVGNPWNVHGGAGGVLVNDSGRIVFDENGELVAINGPHEAFFDEFDDFCAALSAG